MTFRRILFSILILSLGFSSVYAQKKPGIPAKPKKKQESPRLIKLKEDIKLLRLKQQKLQLENSLKREQLRARNARLKQEVDLLTLQNRKQRQVAEKLQSRNRTEKERINMTLTRLRLKNYKLTLRKQREQIRLTELTTKINARKQRRTWDSEVNSRKKYTLTPFRNGKLTISDRRIRLSGPIHSRMAKPIIDKIYYFNNKSNKWPIFLVIDASPGGSVMAGYGILMAMRASKAPIYVVVKSYAASMAAMIAAHAKRSFTYPNAIILHHQVSSYNRGNLTEQRERLAITQEWMDRLARPLAKKMGINVKKLVRLMYKNNSNGDWREFGDKAVKLKWVNNVVRLVEEDSIRSKPVKTRMRLRIFMKEEQDEKGQSFMKLPRLEPHDVWFLYNPDNYYRYN